MLRSVSILLALGSSALAASPIVTTADPATVPSRFQLPPGSFDVSITPKYTLTQSGVEVFDISYPSAVKSAHAVNNTVVGEYFKPLGAKGKLPAVLVLDIMDGQQIVSRGQAVWLATHGIAAVTIQMAYYGPRKPPGTNLRLLMPDLDHSTAAVTQTVLDARRAIAWLATQPDVDANRIGILGTSLGSFIGGITSAAEPKVSRTALLLGGGGLIDTFYDNPKGEKYIKEYEATGGSKEKLRAVIAPFDPLTYAEQLKSKKLLLIAASRDDVVPPAMMTRLWTATGKPEILWVDGTHVGGALYAFPAMAKAIGHFKE